MKTLRICGMLLMAVLMSVGFAACGSDDDDAPENGGGNASIVGLWEPSHITVNYSAFGKKIDFESDVVNGSITKKVDWDYETSNTTENVMEKIEYRFNFKESNRVTYYEFHLGEWELDGDDSGDYYKVNGNKLLISDNSSFSGDGKNGYVEEYTINSLTKDQLKLDYKEYYYDKDGYKWTITYKRVK